MTWQLALFIYLVLSVATQLWQRKLSQPLAGYNRLVNGIFFLVIHYPIAFITAHVMGFSPGISLSNFVILLLASIIFPLMGILTFRASKDVDAGLFSVLGNFNPVLTIGLAILLLSEQLSFSQLIGIILIIASALVVTIVGYSRASKATRLGIVIALCSITMLSVGTVYEAWMIKRISASSYLVYGVGLQTFWMGVIAWPERHKLREMKRKNYIPRVLGFSVVRSLKGVASLIALSLSSAAIFSAFSSFLPVLVVIAGFIFLHERQNIWVKVTMAMVGSVGLIILSRAR